jgi:hypothetical protein
MRFISDAQPDKKILMRLRRKRPEMIELIAGSATLKQNQEP